MRANHYLGKRQREFLSVMLLGVLMLTGGCASRGEPPDMTEGSTVTARSTLPAGTEAPREAPTAPKKAPNAPSSPKRYPLHHAQLTLHVGKTGKLARLGHNHLISGKLIGSAWLDAQGTLHASAQIKVNDLVVDDPNRRKAQLAAGNTNYTSVPTAKHIRDTRANMLSEKVLNAATYPDITATAMAASAAAEFAHANSGRLNTEFSFTVKTTTHVQTATLNWHRSNQSIHWQATLTLSHQQLGLTPFSALGGALRVADELKIELQGSLTGPFSLGSE